MERTKFNLEEYALEIFSSDSYLPINKQLLKHYGPDCAVFLSNLIDKYKYFLNKGLADDDWFFLVHTQQIEDTGLTERKIKFCKVLLKEDGVIETKLKGLPAKEWYRLNLNQLMEILPFRQAPAVLIRQAPLRPTRLINKNKEENKKEYIPGQTRSEEEILIFNGYITPSLFEPFWLLYPKKIDKGKALSKWLTICNYSKSEKPTWEVIREAIQNQKETERWQTPQYIPHATTWLNQRRWLDDPKEMITSRWENENDKRPKFIKDPDSGRYDLCKDGLYRHCMSGEVYIP